MSEGFLDCFKSERDISIKPTLSGEKSNIQVYPSLKYSLLGQQVWILFTVGRWKIKHSIGMALINYVDIKATQVTSFQLYSRTYIKRPPSGLWKLAGQWINCVEMAVCVILFTLYSKMLVKKCTNAEVHNSRSLHLVWLGRARCLSRKVYFKMNFFKKSVT